MRLRFFVLLASAALAGCAATPDPILLPPRVVEVPVTRYVEVPDEYLRNCRWVKDAPPSQVFEAAAGRRRCLEVYESDREAIRAIRGTPVPQSDR